MTSATRTANFYRWRPAVVLGFLPRVAADTSGGGAGFFPPLIPIGEIMDQQEFLIQYFQTLIGWVFPEGVTVDRVEFEGGDATRQCRVVAFSSLSRKKLAGNAGKVIAKLRHSRDFVQANVTLSIYPVPEIFSTLDAAEPVIDPEPSGDDEPAAETETEHDEAAA